jgi:hypothetical protein
MLHVLLLVMGIGVSGVFMVVVLNSVVLDHKVEIVNVIIHYHQMVVQLVFQLMEQVPDVELIPKQNSATHKHVKVDLVPHTTNAIFLQLVMMLVMVKCVYVNLVSLEMARIVQISMNALINRVHMVIV